jgi:glycosyltransferase involved in cell wall biosynthesis
MSKFLGTRETSVIPNFVHGSHLPAPSLPDESASQTWIYAGRLTEEKGIPLLLRDWPRERRLKIVGDGPLRGMVEHAAAETPHTFTYSPLVPRAVLRREVEDAYALVVPSVWKEGLPTVVLEALAVGTPVLLSGLCSSTAELVAKGGVLAFDPRDAHALEKSCFTLSAAYPIFQERARAAWQEHYSPEAWASKILPLYKSVSLGTTPEDVGNRSTQAEGARETC